MSRTIYLDWAATTPLSEEAACAMKPYMLPGIENLCRNANPNSLYGLGRKAFSDLEGAREQLAICLGVSRPDEIIFTSGATEANNMVFWGLVEAAKKRALQKGIQDYRPHIITTSIEHDAVLSYVRRMASSGLRGDVSSSEQRRIYRDFGSSKCPQKRYPSCVSADGQWRNWGPYSPLRNW